MIDAQVEGGDDVVDRMVKEFKMQQDERKMHQNVMSVMHRGGL